MKANELQIGDWVCYCKANNWLTKVEAVNNPGQTYISDVYGIKCYRVKDDPLYEKAPIDFFNVDILHPIPLTVEILEQNGFEVQEQGGGRQDVWNGFGKDNENDIEVEFNGGAPVHVKIDGCGFHFTSGKIHYVHELQHALRLCDIEKEIIL